MPPPSWSVGTVNRGKDGEFVRDPSKIRDWVTADGSSGFRAEPGRYHLYVSLACPWSQRTVIVRALKGLEDTIGISYAHPYRDDAGWAFDGEEFSDELHGWEYLSAAYDETDPDYDGRISVPVLWDRETGRIVSNESADIIKMFNSEWDEWAGRADLDLYPEELRAEIDELDSWIYENVNNAVYQAGFSRSQGAYERAYRKVFDTLPELDRRLADRRYLLGDRITLADWRLWVTLVRFDPVYNLHFRCNGARIIDYPNLWGYTRELYQQPGVAETTAMDQIKTHYYTTHDELNPKRIIPAGPENFDLTAPHGRDAGSLP
jgi:glutathionyl-hydroquinone reductase